jgi:hypothetical protein
MELEWNPESRRFCFLKKARPQDGDNDGVRLACCRAHIRQKFYELRVSKTYNAFKNSSHG